MAERSTAGGLLTRRRFFQALAASALAAGVPLPLGMPKKISDLNAEFDKLLTDPDAWYLWDNMIVEWHELRDWRWIDGSAMSVEEQTKVLIIRPDTSA